MNEIDLSPLEWLTSSYSSGNGQCCMCARLENGGMAFTDSKNPGGAVLIFSRHGWQALIGAVKLGEFD